MPIILDEFTEPNEHFHVNLSLVDSNGINVNILSSQATVEITNIDSKCNFKDE